MEHPHHRLLLFASIFSVAALVLVAAALVIPRMLPDGALDEQSETPAAEQPTDDEPAARNDWPIFITTMTHLEGTWHSASRDEAFFTRQADLVRHGMDLAEEYDAVLTVESEIPMAEGMLRFNDNLLAEVLERGHGAGTHCDISPRDHFSDAQMVDEFEERKGIVDRLIGTDENYGCSGGGTFGDWYVGATGAGFRYLNGLVGFHYLPMPESERPEGWTDELITREYYHYPAPQNLDQYFHPFLVSELGFDEDPNGDLLLTEGALGNVENLAEADGDEWTLMSIAHCGRSVCPYDFDDVAVVADFLATFVAEHDGSRPAKIALYIPTTAFEAENDIVWAAMFSAINEFADEGVQWASQREVYDVMMEYYGK